MSIVRLYDNVTLYVRSTFKMSLVRTWLEEPRHYPFYKNCLLNYDKLNNSENTAGVNEQAED